MRSTVEEVEDGLFVRILIPSDWNNARKCLPVEFSFRTQVNRIAAARTLHSLPLTPFLFSKVHLVNGTDKFRFGPCLKVVENRSQGDVIIEYDI